MSTCKESETIAERNRVVGGDEAKEENWNGAEESDGADNRIGVWSFVPNHLREVGTRRDAQLDQQISIDPNHICSIG